jgi:cation transport ATPase
MSLFHINKRFPSFLLLLGCWLFMSASVYGQSEAQAAGEVETIQHQHETQAARPKRLAEQPTDITHLPTFQAPTRRQHSAKSLLIERAMQRLSKAKAAKKDVNPTSIIMFWLGLFFFLPSALVMLLAFFLITDPFFLPVLLAIYITFGIFALAGLIFLLIALIYLLKGGEEDNGPVIIESEEVE